MLLHDLLALGPDWQVMRQSVRINRPVERWVATRWRGDRKSARIPWPAPAPLSYWEVDLFVHYWNEVVDECEKLLPLRSVEGTLQPLVYGWINAGQAVWHRREPEEALRNTKENSEQMLQWEQEKVAQLTDVAEGGGVRGAQVGEWLWRLAYFLSPTVSGVTPDVVKIFARQDKLKVEWGRARDAITDYHQEIITFLVDNKMNTLAKQLGHAMDDHLKALFPYNGSPSSL